MQSDIGNINIGEYLDWFYSKFNIPYAPQWVCAREDHKALLTLIKENDIKSVLEIGTWTGWTSLCMWLFPGVERANSIDIHAQLGVDSVVPGHMLMPKHFYGHYCKDTPVELEFCDSMQRKLRPPERYDMVFIDGNHDYEHVRNDTELALSMNPKVIAWHDCGSEAAVNQYLEEIGDFTKVDNSLVAYRIINREDG